MTATPICFACGPRNSVRSRQKTLQNMCFKNTCLKPFLTIEYSFLKVYTFYNSIILKENWVQFFSGPCSDVSFVYCHNSDRIFAVVFFWMEMRVGLHSNQLTPFLIQLIFVCVRKLLRKKWPRETYYARVPTPLSCGIFYQMPSRLRILQLNSIIYTAVYGPKLQ